MVPPEIAALWATQATLAPLELVWGEPAARVGLDIRHGPRSFDLTAVGVAGPLRVALGFEARSGGGLGHTVEDDLSAAVLRVAKDEGRDDLDRILSLADALFPARRRGGQPRLGELRSELLTAIDGALAFAAQQACPVAVFVVHEFVRSGIVPGWVADSSRDLDQFLCRLTRGQHQHLEPGQLLGPLEVGRHDWGPSLFIGKARRTIARIAPPLVARQLNLLDA
jgi:hypothetical protein